MPVAYTKEEKYFLASLLYLYKGLFSSALFKAASIAWSSLQDILISAWESQLS